MIWQQALVTARLPQATAVVMKPGEANSPMLFTFVLTLTASPPHIQTCNPGVVMSHEAQMLHILQPNDDQTAPCPMCRGLIQ